MPYHGVIQGFIQDFFAGGGRERIFLHGTVNWMCAKHSHLGGSGGIPPGFFGKFTAQS